MGAFQSSAISTLIAPNVQPVGDGGAFQFSGIQSFTATNVLSIGISAFNNTQSLGAVNLGSSPVTPIGDNAFHGSSLTSLSASHAITIGNRAFQSAASLRTVAPFVALTSIGDAAFQGATSLKEITLPKSGFVVGSDAFAGAAALECITPSVEDLVWSGVIEIADVSPTFSGDPLTGCKNAYRFNDHCIQHHRRCRAIVCMKTRKPGNRKDCMKDCDEHRDSCVKHCNKERAHWCQTTEKEFWWL